MEYTLKKQQGDSLAVPKLVFANLTRADGDTVRVALYLLGGGGAEPAQIAHDLGLKSARQAQAALEWWAGAGLLERGGPTPAPLPRPLRQEEINLAALRDPMLATLTEEAQARLGRTLSHAELSRLAGLYLNEDFSPEVILLCAARLSSGGKKCTLAALDRELHAWRSVGVESGEEAERYIALLDERAKREEETAALFGLEPSQLTLADRRSIRRWYEEFGYRGDMIAEALAQAGQNRSIRYVNGILKAWHARGLLTVAQVRGGGALGGEGAFVRVDRPQPSGHDILQRGRRPLRLKREE